jgi:hypothetical protein
MKRAAFELAIANSKLHAIAHQREFNSLPQRTSRKDLESFLPKKESTNESNYRLSYLLPRC